MTLSLPGEWVRHERTIMFWPCRETMWGSFFAEVQGFIKEHGGNDAMKPYTDPVGKALGHLQQATMWFMRTPWPSRTMPAPGPLTICICSG